MTEAKLKEKIPNIIKSDKDSVLKIYRIILKLCVDDLNTKTYLDDALVKQ